MVRHCHSAIGWLGSLWFFSENFLFSLLFSFWGLFPSRIFLLKAFSFRCDYFGFFGNFLLPMSIFFFEVFFIFYLHAWLDPCGPGNYFPMVWIFFFRPDFFGCFDVVFLPSRSGLDPCGPALFFFNFRPIFSDVSPSDFRLLFGVFWTSIPQLHGHSFFWCTAVIHLSSDVFVGEYFARSRSFFFFCLCSDYLRHSVHNRMDFLSHFWRLGIFQRLSLAFDYFSAVLRLVPARPKSWLLSPCGSRSYSANFDPSFLMLRRGLRIFTSDCIRRIFFFDFYFGFIRTFNPQSRHGNPSLLMFRRCSDCVCSIHKRLAAVMWQRGPLLFFRLFGGFLAIHYWWGTSQIYRKWSPGVGPAVRRSALEPSASPHR